MAARETQSPAAHGARRDVVATLVVTGLIAGIGIAVLVAVAMSTGLTVSEAVGDPYETTGQRFLGVASNVGILAWGAAATACAVAALAHRGHASRWGGFFWASAVVMVVLLIDDALLVHEYSDDIALRLTGVDVSVRQKLLLEAAVFGVYGALFLAYAVRFRDLLLDTELAILGAGLVLLGASTFVDIGVLDRLGVSLPGSESRVDVRSIAEEGLKALGIAYVALYYVRLATASLTPREQSTNTAPALDQYPTPQER